MRKSKDVEHFNIEVGNRIREYRDKLGISQAKLAELVNMDSVSIYRIEKGEVTTSGYAVKKISDALGISTDYLLGKVE